MLFDTDFPNEIIIVRNGYDGTCIVPDSRSDDVDTLYIQIVGRLVQNKHIRCVVADHQAAESEPHLLAAA